jgi:hypothetical protein
MPDADGNARGGLRHPLITEPLAAHVGWSLRAGGYGKGEPLKRYAFTQVAGMIDDHLSALSQQGAKRECAA